VVEFRISSLMNSLLGETEQRFSQAFATLEAMAPNVVLSMRSKRLLGIPSERDGGTMIEVQRVPFLSCGFLKTLIRISLWRLPIASRGWARSVLP